MGTKGKKNVPITARVNAGLFNQKKGITEPLLNVGPAGVYGDNQTKDIPSPSKLKGYSMKKKTESPIKQVNTNVITLGEDTPGTPSTPGKPKKSLRQAYDDALTLGYREEGESFEDYSVRAKKDVNFGTSGSDEIPGSDPVEGVDEVDSIPLQTRDTNDAMSPWRVRQQSRSIKKSGKDVRQSKIKAAKLAASGGGRIDEDGNFQETKKLKGKARREAVRAARKRAKVEENSAELDAFNKNMTARTRQVEMSSDPLKDGTFKSAQRNLEKGDLTKEEQDVRNKKEIEAKKIREAAAAKAAKEKAASSTNPPGPMKTANNFFKTKSPMKKNYFK